MQKNVSVPEVSSYAVNSEGVAVVQDKQVEMLHRPTLIVSSVLSNSSRRVC